jgi:hypothetical protein
LRVLTFLGLGFAGLVGGHALGYAIAVPDVHDRAVLLSHTGHGYLPSASWAAVMLGIAAVVAGVAAGYLRRPEGSRLTFRSLAPRLAVLQGAGFVVLEVAERMASGASLATLSATLLVAGVLTQLAVGAVIALLVAGLRRVGEILGDLVARTAPQRAQSWAIPSPAIIRTLDRRLPAHPRAPPSLRTT